MPSKEEQRRFYKDLAKYWPIISPLEDYLEEGEYVAQVIKHTSPIEPQTVLDLGCGGGHDDFALKKHFQITGVDVSTDMLQLAKKLNPDVRYVKADMRTVRLKKKFDAVTIFDSINYMTTHDDLAALFETAFYHLKPGGVMITIVEETKESFVQNKTKSMVQAQNGIEVSFIENYYDPDPDDNTYEATFVFLIRDKGKLKIETDRHTCGIFTLQTWLDLLEETGFRVSKLDFNVSDPEARTYPLLLCVKSLEER